MTFLLVKPLRDPSSISACAVQCRHPDSVAVPDRTVDMFAADA